MVSIRSIANAFKEGTTGPVVAAGIGIAAVFAPAVASADEIQRASATDLGTTAQIIPASLNGPQITVRYGDQIDAYEMDYSIEYLRAEGINITAEKGFDDPMCFGFYIENKEVRRLHEEGLWDGGLLNTATELAQGGNPLRNDCPTPAPEDVASLNLEGN